MIYRGIRQMRELDGVQVSEGTVVSRDGEVLLPLAFGPRRTTLSPEWGAAQPGARVLAWELLYDALGPVAAGALYDVFADQVVSRWPREIGGVEWSISRDEIVQWTWGISPSIL